MVEYQDDDLQGSSFLRVNLSGSRWQGVVLADVRITDAWIDDLDISGRVGTLVVNGVDVTAYVESELDRRFPERLMLTAADVEGLREAWTMIGERAAATVERARALPAPALDESVDGEFSFLQTLRHLVFATDRWISGPVFDDPDHFHRLGYPHDDPQERKRLALDLEARPSLDEVLELRRERMDRIAELLRSATDDDLARVVDSPNGGTTTVRSCIHVVLFEECAHVRYANRDLDLLS